MLFRVQASASVVEADAFAPDEQQEMCPSTTHVMAELRGAPKVNAEDHMRVARATANGSSGSECGPIRPTLRSRSR